jgi:ribosome-binding factor A
MEESLRQKKVARLVQKELSEIFLREARILFGGGMITVSMVRVSPDLSSAKVYLSLFAVKNTADLLKKIKEETWKIRKDLALRVKSQLRIVPEISFYIDDSLDYFEKIDQLLKK